MGELAPDETFESRASKRDPEGVRADILAVARQEFADNGLSGARIDEIASRTRTSKRMIYYYFGDKEGLYRHVLEEAYRKVRAGEAALDLGHLAPVEALERLVEFTFDHHRSDPEFIRLVMIENIHHGQYLAQAHAIRDLNRSAVANLAEVYGRGVADGSFRPGLDPLELHWQISALSFFNVSNRATFSQIFGASLLAEPSQRRLRDHCVDMVLRYVLNPANSRTNAPVQSDPRTMIDPQLHDFLAVWDGKWAQLSPVAGPAERRAHFETIAAQMRLPTPEDVDCNRVEWVDSPAGAVRIRLFRHVSGGKQPCLVYMHGGAWMQGSPETHWDITARIASSNRQTVVSVDYALAPEHPFPAAFEQCKAVVRWLVGNAAGAGIDASRLAVGGDSAGGNLAAAVALAMRDEGVPLSGQLLIYPACDFDQSRPSYAENAEGPLLKVAGMDRVNAMYCPDISQLATNPFVAPLAAESHAGLPTAFIAVASNDPLRDSGLAYAEALRKAGVEVTVDPGQGLIHGYLRAMEYCAASRDKLETMAAWLDRVNRGESA